MIFVLHPRSFVSDKVENDIDAVFDAQWSHTFTFGICTPSRFSVFGINSYSTETSSDLGEQVSTCACYTIETLTNINTVSSKNELHCLCASVDTAVYSLMQFQHSFTSSYFLIAGWQVAGVGSFCRTDSPDNCGSNTHSDTGC